MKSIYTTLIAALSLGFASLGAAEEGWVSLFDGKTLDGWKKSTVGSAEYSVVDGAIKGLTVEGSPNTFLLSEKQYGDFELQFEVKVHDKLNSGVQIRSREKTEADIEPPKDGKKKKNNQLGRFFGPQVEIEASPGQSGFVYGEATGRGWISPEPGEGAKHDYLKNGEWNQYRIVAKGDTIEVWINGNHVTKLTDAEIYKTHPKGHIGLQVHGIKKETGPFDVYWKNLKIREL